MSRICTASLSRKIQNKPASALRPTFYKYSSSVSLHDLAGDIKPKSQSADFGIVRVSPFKSAKDPLAVQLADAHSLILYLEPD